jgi:NAD-dependent dihydropyrimidine dehydrogenase PreA subunit
MCNRCVRFCPASRKDQPVIFIGRNRKATVNEELCTGCAKCVRICPEKAIEMVPAADREEPSETVIEAVEQETPKQTAPPKKKETPEEKTARKTAEHAERNIRTAIACFLGIIAGIASYFLAGTPSAADGTQPSPLIGILILMVFIVMQKTVFLLIRIDITKLGKKDWFYQAFMTFALWYLTWTIILSTSLLAE